MTEDEELIEELHARAVQKVLQWQEETQARIDYLKERWRVLLERGETIEDKEETTRLIDRLQRSVECYDRWLLRNA